MISLCFFLSTPPATTLSLSQMTPMVEEEGGPSKTSTGQRGSCSLDIPAAVRAIQAKLKPSVSEQQLILHQSSGLCGVIGTVFSVGETVALKGW